MKESLSIQFSFLNAFIFLLSIAVSCKTQNPPSILETYKANAQILITEDPERITLKILEKRFKKLQWESRILGIRGDTISIRLENVDDTFLLRKILTENYVIEFSEIYQHDQLGGLSIIERFIKDSSRLPFYELVYPAVPFHNESTGQVMYPPMLGYVKDEDTAYIRNLFDEKMVRSLIPSNALVCFGIPGASLPGENGPIKQNFPLYFLKNNFGSPIGQLTSHIADTKLEISGDGTQPLLSLQFNKVGSENLQDVTFRNVGRPIAILVNDVVIATPFVESVITNGNIHINGNFTIFECMLLAVNISSGSFPSAVHILDISYAKN